MQKNVASQKWLVFAFDRTDNTPVTGDAANITAKLRKDYGSATATNDTNPTEVEDGYYEFDLTQAETNANVLDLLPESSTGDVQVIGVPGRIFTVPAGFSGFVTPTGAAVTLADGAITAAKIADGALTTAKLGSGFFDGVWSVSSRTLTAATNLTADIASAVWSAVTRTLSAGTNIVLAKGTGITGFNDLSAAEVNAEVDTALADYDGPTNAEMVARTLAAADYATASAQATAQNDLDILTGTDGVTLATSQPNYAPAKAGDEMDLVDDPNATAVTAIQSGLSTHSASDVWSVGSRTLTSFGTLVSDIATAVWSATTRLLTAGTNIVLAKGTGVTGFNDLDADGVRTAVGLASPNLDTQLGDLPTNSELEAALQDGIEDAGLVLVTTTIASLSSQTSFTLTAGSSDNDAYNGATIVIEDASTAAQKAVGTVSDYVGSSKTVTLASDPGVFTMAVGDKVRILPAPTVSVSLDSGDIDDIADAVAAAIDTAPVIVQPMQSDIGPRLTMTTIELFYNENGWTVGPVIVLDANGNAVDLTDFTSLRFVVEQNGTDLYSTTSVTVSGASNNQWTVTGTSAVTSLTGGIADLQWALRGIGTNLNVVLGAGDVKLRYAAEAES